MLIIGVGSLAMNLTPEPQIARVQRFQGGLVFKAQRLCVSLNSRLESNSKKKKKKK